MKLWEKQATFAQNVAKLIQYASLKGFAVTFGDAMRSPEQAALNAKEGKGIVDSLHCKRLAIDLNLFDKDGKYLTDTQSYRFLGDYWDTLHELNRWGGCFVKRPDGNHFQMND